MTKRKAGKVNIDIPEGYTEAEIEEHLAKLPRRRKTLGQISLEARERALSVNPNLAKVEEAGAEAVRQELIARVERAFESEPSGGVGLALEALRDG